MIIADEPTGELDSKTGHEILGLFRSIVHERQMTMLMATHDSLSDQYVDQVLHLQDGQIARIEIPEINREEEAHDVADEALAVNRGLDEVAVGV
ncbi:MAG: hypothetical protein R2867_21775 [Caldilineaceae bacterium]